MTQTSLHRFTSIASIVCIALLLCLIGVAPVLAEGATYITTTDNENNAGTGSSDGDMDCDMQTTSGNYPIEFRIDVATVPTTNAQLSIYAHDVDEESGEIDDVYWNGTYIGHLSGTNETWNTTTLNVPIGIVNQGWNTVKINIATSWVVTVDWGQLLVDGGSADKADVITMEITDATVDGSNVTVRSEATVEAAETGTYRLETTLLDPSNNAVDSNSVTRTINAGTTETLVCDSSYTTGMASGTYRIVAALFDDGTQVQQTSEVVEFEHVQNEGPVGYTNEAPTISGNPPANADEDALYDFTPTVDDADGDTLTFSCNNRPSWASFSTTTGRLYGTPTQAYLGTYSNISITVSDPENETDTLGPFSITVNNTNDAPVISGTPDTSVDEDSPYLFDASVSDVDPGDSHTFSIEARPDWLEFNTTTGVLSGTPENDDVGTTELITITVQDNAGATDSLEAFTIEVINTNDAPVISGTPDTEVDEDSPYAFTPTMEDVDVGDSQVFLCQGRPSWLAFSATTGKLSGTPTNDEVGVHGPITITVRDDSGEEDSLDAFTIEVHNTNDDPSIVGEPITAVNEDSLYDFRPSVQDDDRGDSHMWGAENLPEWLECKETTGSLVGTPLNKHVGVTGPITLTVRDHFGATDSVHFSIEVRNTNDAPVIGGTPASSVAQNGAYSFVPTISDADEGDMITFSISNRPSWIQFNAPNGAIAGSPRNGDVGVHRDIIITARDAAGATSNVGPFFISVSNVNDAPTVSGSPVTRADEDALYSYTPSISDPDGDALTISIQNKPSWAAFDASTGALTGTPTNDHIGLYRDVVITARDAYGAEDSTGLFSITVANTNDAPVISGTPDNQVAEDAFYSFYPTVSDVDAGDSHTFTIQNRPIWASFNTQTGALTGQPSNANVGTYLDITITVWDAAGASDSLEPFGIGVGNVNDSPSINGDPDTSVSEGTPYSFQPQASDPDEGDTLTFNIDNKPSWAAFDTTTGALTGTPANEDVGEYNGIVITVRDALGETDSLPAFSLVVLNVNDAPVAKDDAATTGIGIAVVIDVLANDDDTDFTAGVRPDDTLTIAQVSQPSHGATEIVTNDLGAGGSIPDRDGSLIRYTPEEGYKGIDQFAYTVSDGQGGTGSATVRVTVQSGSISGWVFEDVNGDGVRDQDEQAGFAGVTITATSSQGVSTQCNTDGNGQYQFPLLPPDTYTISHAPVADHHDTSPHPVEINLAANSYATVDFGQQSDEVAPGTATPTATPDANPATPTPDEGQATPTPDWALTATPQPRFTWTPTPDMTPDAIATATQAAVATATQYADATATQAAIATATQYAIATPTPTQAFSPSATPATGPTTAPPSAVSVAVVGEVLDASDQPLQGILVEAYLLVGDLWRSQGTTTTNAGGAYTYMATTTGQYRFRYVDLTLDHIETYYRNAYTFAEAHTITIGSMQTAQLLDVTMPDAVVPQGTYEGDAGTFVDPTTGQVEISAWDGSDITIERQAICPDGSTPTAVALLVDGQRLSMEHISGNTYRITLRVPEDVAQDGDFAIEMEITCAAGGITVEPVGDLHVQLHDPSGQITDALTGEPIVGAQVRLYLVPGWGLKSSLSDLTPNTCQCATSQGGEPWSQPAPVWEGVLANPDMASFTDLATISPAINPQITGETGRYSWDVSEGCWYVQVSAEGYVPATSPVVGVPPAVTDLNIKLYRPAVLIPLLSK